MCITNVTESKHLTWVDSICIGDSKSNIIVLIPQFVYVGLWCMYVGTNMQNTIYKHTKQSGKPPKIPEPDR